MRGELGSIAFFAVVLAVLGWFVWEKKWSPEAQQQSQVQAAQREAKQLEQEKARAKKMVERCASIERVQQIAVHNGRPDLASPLVINAKKNRSAQGCERFDADDCAYRADLMLTLKRVSAEAAEELIRLDKQQCEDEIEFAGEFGIPALKRHLELVSDAVRQAIKDAEDDSQARDYYEEQPTDY